MNPRLYWSVRRELWENRSVYLAPLAVAAVFLFGFLISTIRLAHKVGGLPAYDPAKQVDKVVAPFSAAAAAILMTGFVVAFFYCLDALHGERRDRSILFWKSLPVSDLTTVLSKAGIPLAVLPLLTFVVALITQAIMVMLSSAVLLAQGQDPAALWSRLPLFTMSLVMIYGLTAHVLWFAPIYAWLLLVSAWARRAIILWAVLPFFAIGLIEHLVFGASYFGNMLKYRFNGAMIEAFTANAGKTPITRLSQLDPVRFLSASGLWVGLAFAVICLALAVRLRRNREPI